MSNLYENLIIWYKLDDNAISTIIIDEKGNNGTSIRNTNLMHIDGRVGDALYFITGDYIDTRNYFNAIFQNNFSISVWIKPDDGKPPTGYENDLWGAGSTDYFSGHLELWNYTISEKSILQFVYINSSTYLDLTLQNAFTDGQEDWHHIVITVEQLSTDYCIAIMYLDNMNVKSTGNEFGQLSEFKLDRNFQIGLTNLATSTGKRHFKGSIDDFRIYNKTLSVEEIEQIYNNESDVFMNLNSTGERLFSENGI